ncbi:chloramphenicol phosphotransferase CPT [Kitasatospora cineracea]|uniref:Chloramphenicol 3-O phosphotransferase n=1 Tax=Kitasatospora cineracea TaxID=88074 RepID=A0A8G1X7I4_9ACTN|nr:chloramphenicol phosphotransferase CPT [Kitasatospora cineracea]ROR35369.1 chloramphenicol 3-O phosphotransferase [Kitasatospora cineracea]
MATTRVIVLNGGSSSGKSSLARALQEQLPRPWLAFSIDDLVDALPPALREATPEPVPGAGTGIDTGTGIGFAPDGTVSVGAGFRALEAAWIAGIAATARAGAPVIVDDVFLSGPASQQRWREALRGLDVLWVAVHCDPAEAAARERARGDRTTGMAADQAARVHRGVHYDLAVDTTHTPPATCARTIAAHLAATAGT